jgi:hypothetical protein
MDNDLKTKPKTLYLYMLRFFKNCFVLVMLLSSNAFANPMTFEEMKTAFGFNKVLLPELEAPAIIALSFYPELKNTSIRFEYKKISTTMCTRPLLSSAFKNQRTYVIYINTDVAKIGGVSYTELNLVQRVGIIAHELAHIIDFENKSNFSVVKCGILYSCAPKYHVKMERATDEIVIKKGLGKELFEFSNYVINTSQASEKYKAFKRKNYLLPEEIKQRMK